MAPSRAGAGRSLRRLDALWRHSQSGAYVVVGLFLVLEVAYALLVPPLQNADEASHLHYAQTIERHLQLPGATEPERQQPPLFYLLAAIVLRLGGNLTALRLLSAVIAGIAVGLIIAATRVFIPRHPNLATGAGAVVAALPVTASVGAAVSNASLSWAAGAAMLWCAGSIVRSRGVDTRMCWFAGLALAIGLLTKETDWPVAAVLALVAAARLVRQPAVLGWTGLLAPPLALAGWWFARNLVLFHDIVPPLQSITPVHVYLRSVSSLRLFGSDALRTLFGPELPNGGAIPRAAWARVLTGVLLAALALLLLRAVWRAAYLWRRLDVPTRALARVLTVTCALVVLAWLLNSVFLALQPQARYLLVAAAAPAAAVAWAAADLVRSRRPWVRLVTATTLLALLAVVADSLRVAILRH